MRSDDDYCERDEYAMTMLDVVNTEDITELVARCAGKGHEGSAGWTDHCMGCGTNLAELDPTTEADWADLIRKGEQR